MVSLKIEKELSPETIFTDTPIFGRFMSQSDGFALIPELYLGCSRSLTVITEKRV